MKKKTAKKNPKDATLRNVRAAKKRNDALKLKVVELTRGLDQLTYDVAYLVRQVSDLEIEVGRLQAKRGRK